jgi:hypothetical protein
MVAAFKSVSTCGRRDSIAGDRSCAGIIVGTTPMSCISNRVEGSTMAHCVRCGDEIDERYVGQYAVTQDEHFEFPELHIGDVICMMCFHEVKWPRLVQYRDDDGGPIESLEDSEWW